MSAFTTSFMFSNQLQRVSVALAAPAAQLVALTTDALTAPPASEGYPYGDDIMTIPLPVGAGIAAVSAAPAVSEGHPYGDDGMVFVSEGAVALIADVSAAVSPSEGHPYGDDGMVFVSEPAGIALAGVPQDDGCFVMFG